MGMHDKIQSISLFEKFLIKSWEKIKSHGNLLSLLLRLLMSLLVAMEPRRHGSNQQVNGSQSMAWEPVLRPLRDLQSRNHFLNNNNLIILRCYLPLKNSFFHKCIVEMFRGYVICGISVD